jgi:hypothetical protein
MESDKQLLATVMHLFEFYFNEKHKVVLKGSKFSKKKCHSQN